MSRSAWALFAALSLLWGIPYLLIRVAVAEVDPAVVVFGRTAIGGLLLLPLALMRRELGVVLRHWRIVLLYAFVEIIVPWWLLSYAGTRLDSSTSGLLIAGVPLAAAIVLVVLRVDSFGLWRALGLLIGFAGVAVLIGVDVDLSDGWAVAAAIGTVICYAFGLYMIGHVLPGLPSMGVIVVSLLMAALFYLPVTIWQAPTRISAAAGWSLVGLGVLSTALAFICMFRLTALAGPSRTSVVTYINPAVAIILGVVILSEPLTMGLIVGFPLIIVGAILATSRQSPGPTRSHRIVTTPPPPPDTGRIGR